LTTNTEALQYSSTAKHCLKLHESSFKLKNYKIKTTNGQHKLILISQFFKLQDTQEDYSHSMQIKAKMIRSKIQIIQD